MKWYPKHICYLHLAQYVGYDDATMNPTIVAASQQNAEKITSAKAKSASSVAGAAMALTNQTGGSIMGFTYE